jgi:hypothetical protein
VIDLVIDNNRQHKRIVRGDQLCALRRHLPVSNYYNSPTMQHICGRYLRLRFGRLFSPPCQLRPSGRSQSSCGKLGTSPDKGADPAARDRYKSRAAGLTL